MKKEPAIILLLSEERGVYIPRDFAVDCYGIGENKNAKWHGVNEDDLKVLAEGPKHEDYWDIWSSVERDAYYEDADRRWTLLLNGDLWALCPEAMTEMEKEQFFPEY